MIFRTLLKIVAALLVVAGIAAGYLIWQNNRDLAPPAQEEISKSLDAGIEWLVRNKDSILENNNPMLWWMVQRSALLTGDSRINALFHEYEARYLEARPGNYWLPLFRKDSWVPLRFEDIRPLPYYNWQYLYAVTCDSELAAQPEIAAQNDPGFCSDLPLTPACKTHQLIGLRLMQIHECGDQATLSERITELQRMIRWQLVWDVRVVDVYIQRVLMLVESGAFDLLKPVWVQRVRNAQLQDGGWSGLQPLFGVPGSRYFIAFSNRGVSLSRELKSNFHATVQGVLLFSLLATGKE